MIISASYKTDIPTFYGDWFMNRLKAGYCKVVNPYSGRASTVSLRREDVDGFVFWTKNLGPFLKYLPNLRAAGFPFIVQYTVNGYPRELESNVTDARRSVEHVRQVSGEFGPRAIVWRYDTILLSSLTPAEFHLKNFERLAAAMRGLVDEVVISFMHLYQKTQRNLDRVAEEHGFSWETPADELKRRLTAQLLDIARAHGMALSICSQPAYLTPGAREARCIDAARLEDVGGKRISASLKGNRKECGCFESRDIGEYDTCPHGCVYCYAVRNHALAKQRFAEHDPSGEFLFRPSSLQEDVDPRRSTAQLPLFPPGKGTPVP